MTAWRPTREDVRAAEASAHSADETADAAGLLLADVTLEVWLENEAMGESLRDSRIDLAAKAYRAAKMEATFRWASHADCLAQHNA